MFKSPKKLWSQSQSNNTNSISNDAEFVRHSHSIVWRCVKLVTKITWIFVGQFVDQPASRHRPAFQAHALFLARNYLFVMKNIYLIKTIFVYSEQIVRTRTWCCWSSDTGVVSTFLLNLTTYQRLRLNIPPDCLHHNSVTFDGGHRLPINTWCEKVTSPWRCFESDDAARLSVQIYTMKGGEMRCCAVTNDEQLASTC